MTATASFIEYLGSSVSTATATQFDMVSTMAANATRATYPVSVGNYSVSKCFKVSFGGTFTGVYNVKIYKSDGSLVTGEVVNYGVSSTYHVPTGGSYQDSIATTAISTTAPSTANVTVGGTITYTLTDTENTTDFIYLQSSVTIQSIAGTSNEKTLTITWSE